MSVTDLHMRTLSLVFGMPITSASCSLKSGRIEISVHPSLPPNEVAEIYRKAREELLGRSRVRRLSDKHVQLVAFCVLYTGEPTWRACMQTWNRQCTRRRLDDWRYPETRRFKRDARQARRRVLALSPAGDSLDAEYDWDPGKERA